jgi:hypothetical protein
MATIALGQEPPPSPPPAEPPATAAPPATAIPPPPPAPPPKPPEHKLVSPLRVASFGGVSDSPYVLGIVALPFGLAVGAGLSLDYTSKPNPMSATDPGRTDSTKLGLLLYGFWAVVNKQVWATGPDVTAILNLTGYGSQDPLALWVVEPGWAVYYAPFHAPVIIGTSLGVKFVHVKAVDLTTASFQTAGLRIGYIW